MKLISANIKNFRLLKKLDLNFSKNEKKPLTIIRAANETGKTTCLTALTWCLYGSSSLPNRGNYVLYPSDEIKNKIGRVEISVEIEFELEHVVRTSRDNLNVVRSLYRIRRVCFEDPPVNNNVKRSPDQVDLWEVTNNGTTRVLDSNINSIIEKALPESLKDVYFTDGDRAMSFIEAGATQGVKRKRVTNAIESLLGLTVLENTVNHLGAVITRFSKEIDNKDYAAELEKLNDRIIWDEAEIVEHQEKVEISSSEKQRIEKEIAEKEKQIENTLKLGDKEDLINKKNKIMASIQRSDNASKEAYKSLVQIISSDNVSKGLLSEHIEKAKKFLSGMNNAKQLPQVNIPILEELLDKDSCFCGADLSDNTLEGTARRKKIEVTIQASQDSDKIQKAATSLFYRIRSTYTENASQEWLGSYSSQLQQVQNILTSLNDYKIEMENLEESIDKINDTELKKYREQQENLKRSLYQEISKLSTSSSRIEELNIKLSEAKNDLSKIKNKIGKTNTSTTNWDIAEATKDIFLKVIEVLRQEELKKVSCEMNRIFLAMIGADSSNPDYGLIQEAELTKEFDIVVYGPNKHLLNPDQDLNGASRRAITLAFILALTKVSQVEAPNIIDTPLGMMSGFVKQSVLLRTIEESSQVILFLTHDEIRGVEEILDMYADVIFTLTNPVHYPKMLANKPDETKTGIVRCECNHREHCHICERKDAEVA